MPEKFSIKSYNADLINFLLKKFEIQPTQTVLDVGFGNGFLLSKVNCEKFGIEKGDKFVEKEFDYIFLLDVIEHLTIEQVQGYFEYFKRTLKSNGKIIVSTPNINNIYQLIGFWDEETHIRPYTVQTMQNICLKNDFKCSVVPFHWFKHPFKILVNFCLGLDWHNKNIFLIEKEGV